MPGRDPQSAAAVFMVRPRAFGFNPQTAPSNAFQSATLAVGGAAPLPAAAHEAAVREFDRLAEALARAGVRITVAEDTASPRKPDAVFPNNWVSFHRDGSVVLYPMLAANRRHECREDVVHQVIERGGYRTSRTVDLRHREQQAKYLEGTGSLVLDRTYRVAYAALSPRTDGDVLGEFAQLMGYELVIFEAADSGGTPVYHTNVAMAVGSGFAVVCEEAIPRLEQRAAIAQKLRSTGHDVIAISRDQMQQYAGNLLELAPPPGRLIAMSTSAWRAFDPAQRRRLEAHGSVLTAEIPVIERLGGGGVRCMLAEIHLPEA
jgi:hypothetical protein